ncbi:hypothetical protein NDU88_004369 [Pleurodeles waltl]|uniref:Uncharacterized protein n=1 Tax=Pleurodeles waltl TaxID=8319 RepID=A0AAV7W7Y1_PLEWA|nr:hypothetical protein NDU88_004369 [Pleurodeles waltl]
MCTRSRVLRGPPPPFPPPKRTMQDQTHLRRTDDIRPTSPAPPPALTSRGPDCRTARRRSCFCRTCCTQRRLAAPVSRSQPPREQPRRHGDQKQRCQPLVRGLPVTRPFVLVTADDRQL